VPLALDAAYGLVVPFLLPATKPATSAPQASAHAARACSARREGNRCGTGI